MKGYRGAALIVGIACVVGCNGPTPPTRMPDLTGTWVGDLTLKTTDTSGVVSATVVLVQSGVSVSGTAKTSGAPADVVSGSLAGSILTINGTPPQVTGDDCHLFHWTIQFTASASTLMATGASNVLCSGDNAGGHKPLQTLTGASGTLTKQ